MGVGAGKDNVPDGVREIREQVTSELNAGLRQAQDAEAAGWKLEEIEALWHKLGVREEERVELWELRDLADFGAAQRQVCDREQAQVNGQAVEEWARYSHVALPPIDH
jgi:hypothetical protein